MICGELPERTPLLLIRCSPKFKHCVMRTLKFVPKKVQIQEDIIDLKGRSMLDNLLFYGLSECKTLGFTSLLSQDHTSNAAGECSVHTSQSPSDTQPGESQDNQPISKTLRGAHSVLYSEICQRETVSDTDDCGENVLYLCVQC